MTNLLRVLLSVGVVLGLGCAKDRDVEDFNRAQAEKDAAGYNAVNGHYTGLVKSPEGKVIGALDIMLETRFVTTPSTNGTASIGTPVLVLELTFEDTRIMSVTADDGSFNPDSGRYEATIKLNVHTGTSSSPTTQQSVSIVANVNGGQINGTIQALGYSGYGSSFNAQMNGPSIDTLAAQANVRANGPSEDVLQATSYGGQTKFLNGTVTKPVRMVILEPRLGGDDDFYDLLVPVKNVQVSFNYDASAHIISSDGRWDLRTGLLTGTTQVPVLVAGMATAIPGVSPTVNVTVTYDCTTKTTGTTSSVKCSHFTNQNGGHSATTTGTLQSTDAPDPVDNTATAASIDRTFQGKARGTGESGREITLYFSYAARSRLQDIYDLFVPNAQKAIQVTFFYSDAATIGFTQAIWDSSTGAMDATTDPALSSAPGTTTFLLPELHCTGFFFDKQRRPFTCIYKTNRSAQMTLTMQP